MTDDWTITLFEIMDDVVLLHDLDGTILEANAAACRRLGYPREELLRLSARHLDASDDAANFAKITETLAHSHACRFEGRQRTKDGRILFVDVHATMVRLHGQLAVLVVARDITHRIATERALSDSEAVYLSLVESLPQFILRKDLAGRFTFGNQRYCSSHGLSPNELRGKTDFDLFPAELASKYVRDDKEVIRSGNVFETVEGHRLPDGKQIFVQVVKTPVHDAQGQIIGIQGIFWDVTEQRRAALAVADSERRYRQLTEATLDGIIVVDQDERISLFNPAAERMFGYRADEVLGQPVTLLIPERQLDARRRHFSISPVPFAKEASAGLEGFRRLLETGQSPVGGRTVEVQARRKDGTEFPVEVALSVLSRGGPEARGQESGVRSQEPVQFLGALRDLTERNKIRSILVQNEKLASIGMLSAGVAHEINNPLAFVANNMAVLERDCQALMAIVNLYEDSRLKLCATDPAFFRQVAELADKVDLDFIRGNLMRVLTRTREGVDRVTRIVHSLRGLARTDNPKRQETSLTDLIAASLEILRNRLKKSNIAVEQHDDLSPRVFCVATQISQVILNLLVNAVQAIEAYRQEGGLIVIRTRRLHGEMMLEIGDNGGGIAADDLPRLFDPFFTTKDVGEGTGLGLSISHNIVTAHGGRVEVDSRPGQGAVFRMYLPLRTRV